MPDHRYPHPDSTNGLLGVLLALALVVVAVCSTPPGIVGTAAANSLPAGPQGTDSPLPASWLVWQTALQRVEREHLDQVRPVRPRRAGAPVRSLLLHGPHDRREVALTFDDGPHPSFTPRLLALLRRYHARATFLVVGQQARAYPKLVLQEVADGHSVGNHTYHHVDLVTTPQPDLSAELVACGDVLQAITGKRPHLFRPPGGQYNQRVTATARALGYTTVLWTDNSHDYLNPGVTQLERRVFGGIANGEIILMHDGAKQTLEVLPRVLEYLQATGRQCVTVDQMLRQMAPPARRHGLPTGRAVKRTFPARIAPAAGAHAALNRRAPRGV
jgi:peptidoglycan/xylan/chitin deacetylase (PgdA/CDA1 family)